MTLLMFADQWQSRDFMVETNQKLGSSERKSLGSRDQAAESRQRRLAGNRWQWSGRSLRLCGSHYTLSSGFTNQNCWSGDVSDEEQSLGNTIMAAGQVFVVVLANLAMLGFYQSEHLVK